MANIFGVNIGNPLEPTKEEYAAGTEAGVYTGGYGDVGYGHGGFITPDHSYLKGLFYEAEGAAEEQAPKATRERPTAAPSGGGGSAPAPVVPPKPVEPEPFKLNTTTGSAIGGDISATLGSVGKSPYDTAAKGLKGLTTPTGRTPRDKDKDLERERFGQGLFNIGLTKPGSGTGVQV
jgi:hypothetical protein